jgi:hypothetical protein
MARAGSGHRGYPQTPLVDGYSVPRTLADVPAVVAVVTAAAVIAAAGAATAQVTGTDAATPASAAAPGGTWGPMTVQILVRPILTVPLRWRREAWKSALPA